MNRAPLLFSLLLLASCSEKPISTERTNNAAINAELMLEHDGVRLWRVADGGRTVYFTTPTGHVSESHSESCGKNCTKTVTTQTLRGQP